MGSLLAGALCLLAMSCSSGEGELVGFGKYKIGKTTPAHGYVMGKCRPEGENTFCFLNRSPSIAGHKTQTDLYFKGHEDDAPLIEISVGVWNCQVGPVSADLQSKLGDPKEVVGKRALWTLKKMTVIALLPKDEDLCMVHFLDPSDTKRIASLFPGTAAPRAEVSPTEPTVPAPAKTEPVPTAADAATTP